MGDLNTFQARYIALRQSMVDDGIRFGLPFHSKDLQTISERILSEGSSFVKVTLPQLGKALDQGLVSGRFTSPPNFRLKRNTSLPLLCHSLWAMIFSEDGSLKSSPNPIAIQFLRQFLLFDSKLHCEPSSQQREAAISGFIERQVLLRKKRVPIDNPVIIRARALLGRVLRGCDLSVIEPGHGPGSVAEKTNRFERWDFTYWSARAERVYPFLLYGTPNLRCQLERGVAVRLHRKMVTRCCLVPKDFKGPRLISAESAVTQYLQQGQMRSLMHYFRRHPILSRSIRLDDQSFNQIAAEESVVRDTATLDLSNASDTVSCPLVWFLLSEVPQLRRQLMATRSYSMLVEGREVRLSAFAPMGSATCFPVETLVFWALSMGALMLVRSHVSVDALGYSRRVCSMRDSELASEIRVFGDDIIIPKDALATLISTLVEVGCSPNMSKTCSETPFRESCGSEWFNGFDVTITRNKRYHYDQPRKIVNHPVLLDLQRKFFLQGYRSTASLLYEWAQEIVPTPCIPVHWLPDPSGILTEKYRLNVDASRKTSWGTGAFAQALSNADGRSEDGTVSFRDASSLNIYQRQDLASDTYPFAFSDEFQINGARVRYNRQYQRFECRVPREFNPAENWQSGEYSRLLARLLSDSVERIAIRNRKVKMAWSNIPIPLHLSMKG